VPSNVFRHSDRARRFRLACLQLAVALPTIAITSSLGRPTDLSRRLHSGPGVSNHPVNVVPSAAVSIPPGWPLDAGGSITCTTCHLSLPPLNGNGGTRLRKANTAFSDPRAYCMNCHRDSLGGSAATAHWTAVPKAHILRESFQDHSTSGSTMDGASRDCLSCHDGVTASDAGHETGLSRGSGYFGDKGRNHPIGVRYPHAGTRRVEVPLRPAAALPETVRLPGGVVSCVSCHDLYHPDKYRLSVPIEGSRLCLTCHDMD
jgi:hypothetical protein